MTSLYPPPALANGANHSNDVNGRLLWLIVRAGLVAATFDLIFACTFNGLRSGVSPIRVMQAIASGWLGTPSFDSGLPAAALGVVSHYGILIVAAFLYFAAMRSSSALRRHAVIGGICYGAAIYAFMNWVVLPLSNAPKFKGTAVSMSCDFLCHLFLIGLPMSLLIHRALQERRSN